MAWSWRKTVGGGGDDWPDSKRRKVDVDVAKVEQTEKPDDDDEWGDDDFTQDQLEELALLDSQVALQPQAPVAAVRAEQPSVSRAEQPSLSRAEPSLSRAEQPTVSFATPVGAARRSTSSSSNSSAVPQSLSSSRSTSETSPSLSSHSSSNGKLDPSVELVHTLQARLDEKEHKAQEAKNCYDGEVRTLRERMRKQEEELEKLRALRDENYEQQKQSLNEEIHKLKSQLGNLTTQSCFKDREYQSLQEKYAVLQQKVKKIEQQQQSTSGMLNVRLQLSPKPASPRKVSVEPSPPSKLKQQEARDSASSSKASFPTAQTFMEQTLPVCQASPVKSVSGASCQMPGTGSGNKPVQRRLHLNTGSSQAFGEMAGPQVVRHLLQLTELEGSAHETVPWDPGLAGLLQDMSTTLKITGLTYSREKESQFLMPLRPKKHTQGLRSASLDTSDGTVLIVTRQNLQLAIEGITQLLQDTNNNPGTGGLDFEINRISDTSVHTNNPPQPETVGHPGAGEPDRQTTRASRSFHGGSDQNSGGCHDASRRRETSSHSGALLILPLLTNYIQHYVDLVHSSSAKVSGTLNGAETGTSPLSQDSSTASSLQSLSSHLGLLLQEGKIYASNMEGCALTALRCLAILIHLCPAVRHAIVTPTHHFLTPLSSRVKVGSSRSSSSSTVETEQSKKSLSSADADDEGSTGSSEVRIIKTGSNQSNQSVNSCSIQRGNKVNSSLFHLVLRLAGQDVQHGQSNPEVVIVALRVLTCLCQRSTKEELPKLEPIITREILARCFQQTKQTSILVHAVRLLLSLAKCSTLLAKLCTKSDSCPLYLMHRVCSMKAEGMFELQAEYVMSLSNIISEHRSGLHFLLSNSCPCTDKLVAAVVLTLYNLFSTYTLAEPSHQPHILHTLAEPSHQPHILHTLAEPSHQPHILHTLAQGASLLHTLAQGDGLFAQHCGPVQHQYVRLITGLSSILKPEPQTWEHYLQVIDELNEFEDSSDTSQESADEDKMDQS